MNNAQFYYLLRRGVFGGGLLPVVRDFQSRVTSDGGTIEALQCLNKAVATLPPFDFGRYTFDAYDIRVSTDGGETEAHTCTINNINNLN